MISDVIRDMVQTESEISNRQVCILFCIIVDDFVGVILKDLKKILVASFHQKKNVLTPKQTLIIRNTFKKILSIDKILFVVKLTRLNRTKRYTSTVKCCTELVSLKSYDEIVSVSENPTILEGEDKNFHG